jgi:hypothetical protein
MKTCATCTHCESRAHPPMYVPVRWCRLLDEPAVFVCSEWLREAGAD